MQHSDCKLQKDTKRWMRRDLTGAEALRGAHPQQGEYPPVNYYLPPPRIYFKIKKTEYLVIIIKKYEKKFSYLHPRFDMV